MSFSKEELILLRACHDLMRDMERNFDDVDFQESDLFKLAALLRSFSLSSHRELEHLSQIAEHLHPQMSKRHFLNFMVPVERCLNRNLSDESFLVTSQDRIAPLSLHSRAPLFFVLENIRSAFNVGSIFRLADCIGAQEIHLCGYTPLPGQDALEKTSLGTTATVAWKQFDRLEESLSELKNHRVRLLALETAKNSNSLFDFRFEGPTAWIVGNERFGLEESALQMCDHVVSIPTFGHKNSLNVANALSIAAYEWRRQWK